MRPVNTISYLLQHVSMVSYRQSDQVLQERFGIGMSQFKILMMAQWFPNMQQRSLAEALGQTEASVSRQVKLLHEKGMLVTHIDPKERRRHITIPTPRGIKITVAAREILEEYHEPMLANFTDKQRRQLAEMLQILHDYACAPGKLGGCARPLDLADIYNNQKERA
ncbi:MAG TPA: MarR family winged helix-turn-helix transcriptional regulator [Candidatus Saccharimonadales bacterium]|nr:MarR family winged helix-turn-helix transcriptional regulator [Candidatus Saccharimonadales bacterium]